MPKSILSEGVEDQDDLDELEPETKEEPLSEGEPAEGTEGLPAEDETEGDEQPDESAEKATDEAPEETPPTFVAPEGEAYGFTADGLRVDLEGAVQNEHGVWIPTDQLGRLQGHLADRSHYQQRQAEYERQLAALDPQINNEVLQARHILSKLGELMDEGPEAVAAWLDDLTTQRPILEAQAAQAAAEAELQARSQGYDQVEQNRQREELGPQMETATRQAIANLMQTDELKGLDAEALYSRIRRYDPSLFFVADKDYPVNGITKGQICINLDFLEQEALDDLRRAGHKTAREVAEAANKSTEKPANEAPPIVGTTGQTPAAARKGKYKDFDEWEEAFDAGGGE